MYTAAVLERNPCYTGAGIPRSLVIGDNIPMGFSDNLRALRKQRKLTQAQLAEMLGVEQPTIQRYEKGRSPTLAQAEEIADALGVPLPELVASEATTSIGPRLMLKGEVQAGAWKPAVEWPPDEWREYTGRADVSADARHRFGLRVVGESMNEVYPHGTILDCVSVFGRAEIEPGKNVIVIQQNDAGEFEATVKQYVVDKQGKEWLRPRSDHPDFQRWIALDEAVPGIVERVITGVVVASIKPE